MKGETTRGSSVSNVMTGRGAVLRGRRTSGTEDLRNGGAQPRTAHRTRTTPLPGSHPRPGAAAAGTPGRRGPVSTEPGLAPSPRPCAQRWVTWRRGQGGGGGGAAHCPASPSAGGPPGPRPPLPGALTLSSRAPPGAPLRTDPASVPRAALPCSPGGAGEDVPRAAARSRRAPGPTKAARRPPPAPRPAPRGPRPAAPGPPPPVTEAGPRPDTGGAQEERARRRVAGVNVPDVGRVGAASAPSAAGTPRPVPQPRRGARGRRSAQVPPPPQWRGLASRAQISWV